MRRLEEVLLALSELESILGLGESARQKSLAECAGIEAILRSSACHLWLVNQQGCDVHVRARQKSAEDWEFDGQIAAGAHHTITVNGDDVDKSGEWVMEVKTPILPLVVEFGFCYSRRVEAAGFDEMKESARKALEGHFEKATALFTANAEQLESGEKTFTQTVEFTVPKFSGGSGMERYFSSLESSELH